MTTSRKAYLNAIASAALLLCAAQAQAQNFSFVQKFDLGGFDGFLNGQFVVNDADANNIFEASEMTFTALQYNGIAPTLGNISLSFATAAPIDSYTTTRWFANDATLGDAFNGFFISGASATGTQLAWVAGPANFFDYGNTPGLGSGGDAQNSTFRFGQIDLFTSGNAGGTAIASAQSNDYATIVPTPIPEPATYLMMLGGIAALVAGVRRRAA
jgi:hypothetical protein